MSEAQDGNLNQEIKRTIRAYPNCGDKKSEPNFGEQAHARERLRLDRGDTGECQIQQRAREEQEMLQDLQRLEARRVEVSALRRIACHCDATPAEDPEFGVFLDKRTVGW